MNREIFENSSVNVEVVTSKVLTTFKESSITIERTKKRILKVHAFKYDYCWRTFDGAFLHSSNVHGVGMTLFYSTDFFFSFENGSRRRLKYNSRNFSSLGNSFFY